MAQLADEHGAAPSYIRRVLTRLLPADTVAELRVLRAGSRQSTWSGYYRDRDALARDAARWSGRAGGVYVTLNPVQPALLARRANRIGECGRDAATTSDKDIARRCWLPLDFDYQRPKGISSTDEEHQAALDAAKRVRDYLREEGWPEPVLADSGNGAHLLYAIDLPNDQGSLELVKRVLRALTWWDGEVRLDVSNANAARIWKLYGTLACKADDTPERPHRPARIVDMPAACLPVPRELIDQLAAQAVDDPTPVGSRLPGAPFDVPGFISEQGLQVAREGPYEGGHRWILSVCPWDADHTDNSAYILQFPSGAVAAGCHHNGCAGKNWRALRALYPTPLPARTLPPPSPPPVVDARPPPVAPAPPAPRFRFLSDAESDAIPPAQWLVNGYLLAGAINVVHGEGGAAKSLACLDLGLTLAAGQTSWHGVPCKPGPVLYLAAEGPDELSKRKRAWKARFGVPSLPDFHLLPDQVPFMDTGAISAVIGAIPAGVRPVLIVVDTLARAMGADGNENDTQDMNGFVAACDLLRRTTGAAVVIVHHDNKMGGIRGNLSLGNAARNSLKFSNDQELITVESDKHNNSGKQLPLRFVFEVVPDPMAPDDPEQNTVVLQPASEADRDIGRPLNDRERTILAALCEPVFQHGANLSEMRDATRLENWQIFRALNALVKRGLAIESGMRKTPTRRHKATAGGYSILGLVPPWQQILDRAVTEIGGDGLSITGTMNSHEQPVSLAGVTAMNNPAAGSQARMNTSDTRVTHDEQTMSTPTVRSTDMSTPFIRGAHVSVDPSVPDGPLPVAAGLTDPPDPYPPRWGPPPDDAPPRPPSACLRGHSAISVAWDEREVRWRCRSCWEVRRE